jgi:hypothetical protein
MRQNFILSLLALLLLITDSHALHAWDQAEAMLEEQKYVDSIANVANESEANGSANDNLDNLDYSRPDSTHDLLIEAIDQASQKIRRDLAAELDGLLERLPQIIQGTPPPARVVEAKAGQQLVWAADAAIPAQQAPPPSRPRPRPIPPPKPAAPVTAPSLGSSAPEVVPA